MTPGDPRPDPDADDARLAAGGDMAAFSRLVERWQGRLVGLAWRFCRDRWMAEDLAQDAFVRAFRALPAFRGESAFGTWLTAIALNTYRTGLKRAPLPAQSVPVEAALKLVGAHDQTAEWERSRRDEAVRAQVLRLPAKYREPLLLYYFQEQNLIETARVLDLREGTLKARLHRGRELLKRRLVSLGVIVGDGGS